MLTSARIHVIYTHTFDYRQIKAKPIRYNLYERNIDDAICFVRFPYTASPQYKDEKLLIRYTT